MENQVGENGQGKRSCSWNAFFWSGSHNQMLEMGKNKAMLFSTRTLSTYTRSYPLCYFPHIPSQLPTIFSSETFRPIYSLYVVSNLQWFCLSWTWMCKHVTSAMSFGSERCWPTTHFVKPFNALEHPCPPWKYFFPVLQKHLEVKGTKFACILGEAWYSSYSPQLFCLITINVFSIFVECWRFHTSVTFSATCSFLITVILNPR